MTKQQMELGLDHSLNFRRAARRQRRITRARWWFAQMRQIVSQVAEPAPINATQPQQASLTLGAKTAAPSPSRRFDLN